MSSVLLSTVTTPSNKEEIENEPVIVHHVDSQQKDAKLTSKNKIYHRAHPCYRQGAVYQHPRQETLPS